MTSVRCPEALAAVVLMVALVWVRITTRSTKAAMFIAGVLDECSSVLEVAVVLPRAIPRHLLPHLDSMVLVRTIINRYYTLSLVPEV